MITPTTLPDGSRVWLDHEIKHVADALTSYDDRLALVQNRRTNSWEIWRVAEDGQEHIVMRSKPGAKLGTEIVGLLAAKDTQRHGDRVVDGLIAHNLRVEKDAEDKRETAINEAFDKMMSKSWHGRVTSVIEDTM